MNGQEFYEMLKDMTEKERRDIVDISYDNLYVVRSIRDNYMKGLSEDSLEWKRLAAMTDEQFENFLHKGKNEWDWPPEWAVDKLYEDLEDMVWDYATEMGDFGETDEEDEDEDEDDEECEDEDND